MLKCLQTAHSHLLPTISQVWGVHESENPIPHSRVTNPLHRAVFPNLLEPQHIGNSHITKQKCPKKQTGPCLCLCPLNWSLRSRQSGIGSVCPQLPFFPSSDHYSCWAFIWVGAFSRTGSDWHYFLLTAVHLHALPCVIDWIFKKLQRQFPKKNAAWVTDCKKLSNEFSHISHIWSNEIWFENILVLQTADGEVWENQWVHIKNDCCTEQTCLLRSLI